jgi:hypothetical protein
VIEKMANAFLRRTINLPLPHRCKAGMAG